ncbi:MAG: hypothetical protein AAF702_01570 [Chloroflexota bacterium]
MARRKSTVLYKDYHIKLRLKEGEDDDLLEWIASISAGQRAMAVKMALRSGGMELFASVNDESEEEDDLFDDFLV